MPVVAAINGAALGGGFEFSLACDYRIASTATQIGFPECSLGILPGWGGTVRFPRLAGIDTAVEWIALAQIFDPATGLKTGVLDAVVTPEKLREAALHTLRQCSAGKMDYKERRRRKQAPLRHNAIELTLAVESARGMALVRIGPNYPAPLAAIDAMQKAAGLDRDAALRVEVEAFAELAGSDPARALVGIFLNDQAVAKKAKD
jgi:3-hydroxyacyl-CoA dehydrogenase/enoyl-CoA hydratase/3-hydroxybutyryl-CoA epimerase/enoyl-CoA isomerase